MWGAYAATIGETVEALATSSRSRPRIVVVDNASDPPLAATPGATVLRLEQRVTIGAVRNAGLAQVDTPWVQFWDADDRPLPDMLDHLHELVGSHPDAIAAWLPSRGWAGGERTVPWPWPRRQIRTVSRLPTLLRIASLVVNPFPTTGPSLLRTDLVRDAGGFSEDVSYGEDWALATLLAQRGRIVGGHVPGRLYRVDPGSLTSQASLSTTAIGECYASLRGRVRRDRAASPLIRALLPLVALLHDRRAGRWDDGAKTGGGFYGAALRELTTDDDGGRPSAGRDDATGSQEAR